MRILVVGAAGPTGREVTAAALAHGHEVVAFVHGQRAGGWRRASGGQRSGAVGGPRGRAAFAPQSGLRVVEGDVLDAGSVREAIKGCDAVISALGDHRRVRPTRVYSAGVAVVLEAMRAQGISRLVAVSAAGVGAERSPAVPAFFRLVVVPLLARPEYADMARMESVLASSHVEWTVAKPLWLRSGPALTAPRLAAEPFHPARWGLRRADLAQVLLGMVEGGAWVRSRVWVAY